MKCSLEREPHLHADEELLVPKDELQDVDQPQEEVQEVVDTTMQRQPSEGACALQKLSDWLGLARRL